MKSDVLSSAQERVFLEPERLPTAFATPWRRAPSEGLGVQWGRALFSQFADGLWCVPRGAACAPLLHIPLQHAEKFAELALTR